SIRFRATRYANTLPTSYARRVVEPMWIAAVSSFELCVQAKGACHDSNDPRDAVYRIANAVSVARALEVDVAADMQYRLRSGAARAAHRGRLGSGLRRGAGAREAAIRVATGRTGAQLP